MKKTILLICYFFISLSLIAPSSGIKPTLKEETEKKPVLKEKINYNTQKFLTKMAYRESSNVADTVNSYGYLGKYQFSYQTLMGLGINCTKQEFLLNPSLQDRAMILYLKYNEKILREYIKKYSNSMFNGIYITKSGILAAAHLAGAGGVMKWFDSNGTNNRKDANGTTIETYLKAFQNYNLNLK